MYDGRIVRELAGAEITETNIVASALNIDAATPAHAAAGDRPCLTISPSGCARTSASSPRSLLFCVVLSPLQPGCIRRASPRPCWCRMANEIFTLAMLAMAQTVPVLMSAARPLGRRRDDHGGLVASYLLAGTAGGTPLHLEIFGLHLGLGTFPGGIDGILLGMAAVRRDRHARRLHQRLRRRLWTHPADHRDARDRRGLYRRRALPAPDARRQDRRAISTGR